MTGDNTTIPAYLRPYPASPYLQPQPAADDGMQEEEEGDGDREFANLFCLTPEARARLERQFKGKDGEIQRIYVSGSNRPPDQPGVPHLFFGAPFLWRTIYSLFDPCSVNAIR